MKKVANLTIQGTVITCLFDKETDIKKRFKEVMGFEYYSEIDIVNEVYVVPKTLDLFVNFGELVYDKKTQKNVIYLGFNYIQTNTSRHVYLQSNGLFPLYNFSKYPANIGTYLIQSIGYNNYLPCTHKKNLKKLRAVLESSNISDFSICDSNAALRFLQDATGLPFEMQDKQPKQNKGGLFHVPVKISWTAVVLNDAVPCKIVVTYRYPNSATRQTHVEMGWDVKVTHLT